MVREIKNYIKPEDLKLELLGEKEFILSKDLKAKVGVGLYLQADAKAEWALNFGKTKRDQNGNIIYNQGLKANLYATVDASLENSITIFNKNDSITGILEVSNTLHGDGFLLECYRSSVLDTNTWLLKYYFNLSIGIGSLIELFTFGGIAKIIKEILKFDILTTIEGEINLKEKAKESKKELYKYAMNILYNEFKNSKTDEINVTTISKVEKSELKQKLLLKAWKIKHFEIKQNLVNYAKNRVSNFIPSFLNALTNIIKKLLDRKIKNKFIKKTTFFVISNIKNLISRLSVVLLLSIFSKPMEKVINEITLNDLKKI